MSTSPTPAVDANAEPTTATAENAYLVIGLLGIVVIGVALLQSSGDRLSVVPTLVGAAGLAFRWRLAPLVLLGAVGFTQVAPIAMQGEAYVSRPPSLAIEMSLCGAVLAYVVAQYRLVGLTTTVFPSDPRRPLDRPPRDTAQLSRWEVPAVLVAVAGAVVGAFFLREVVSRVPPPWGIRAPVWLVGLLTWLVGVGLLVVASVIGHLGWRRLSPDEAALYVRDVLWRETRGEQRRIQRWRAWGQRRRERQK